MEKELLELAALARELGARGHTPATSGNYSLRSTVHPDQALVSESGLDKSRLTERSFLPMDIRTGELLASGRRASDEADIHLAIYRATNAGCVLHGHLLESLLFADLFPGQDRLKVEGLELLKGLKGVRTHQVSIELPCFPNTQDIPALSLKIEEALRGGPLTYGVLIRGHGLYTWGQNVVDAARHLEVLEYVFKYYVYSRRMGP